MKSAYEVFFFCSLEIQWPFEGDWRVRDEARMAQMVLARGVRLRGMRALSGSPLRQRSVTHHERMDQDHVSSLSGQLSSLSAYVRQKICDQTHLRIDVAILDHIISGLSVGTVSHITTLGMLVQPLDHLS